MYVVVYSPKGELFEVTRERADKLLLQEGWTQTPPTFTEPAEVEESFIDLTDQDAAHEAALAELDALFDGVEPDKEPDSKPVTKTRRRLKNKAKSADPEPAKEPAPEEDKSSEE